MKLFDFFAAYFNQDWMIEDATPAGVVARFLRDAPAADLTQVSSRTSRAMASAKANATPSFLQPNSFVGSADESFWSSDLL